MNEGGVGRTPWRTRVALTESSATCAWGVAALYCRSLGRAVEEWGAVTWHLSKSQPPQLACPQGELPCLPLTHDTELSHELPPCSLGCKRNRHHPTWALLHLASQTPTCDTQCQDHSIITVSKVGWANSLEKALNSTFSTACDDAMALFLAAQEVVERPIACLNGGKLKPAQAKTRLFWRPPPVRLIRSDQHEPRHVWASAFASAFEMPLCC